MVHYVLTVIEKGFEIDYDYDVEVENRYKQTKIEQINSLKTNNIVLYGFEMMFGISDIINSH